MRSTNIPNPALDPIPANRMLVPYGSHPGRGRQGPAASSGPANACFLASLLASAINAETVRSRRKTDPGTAIACYRATQARIAA
ncbi:MAG: hypothetical protein ACRCTD_05585 [Beijerinckiaceae bacterium]